MDIALVKVMLVWMDSDSNDSAMRTELSIWNGLVYDGGHGFHCG